MPLFEADKQFPADVPMVRKGSLALMLKNSVASLGRLGSGWLLVVVVPPFLTRHLPTATYSVWMLILQLAAYVTLVQGGIELSVSRYVARADHLGEQQQISQILGAAALLLGLFGILLMSTAAVASWKFAWLFPEVPASLLAGARYALLIVAVAYSINLPFAILSGMFQGTQKFEATAIAVSLGKVVTAVGIIWVAMHSRSLLYMACCAAVGPFLQSVVMLIWRYKDRASNLVSLRPGSDAVHEFFRFCLSILVVQFTMVLIAGLDLPIVAAFDFGATGYYAAATAAAAMFAVPSTAIVSTFLPVASGLVATRRPQEVGLVLLRATRYATALLCTIAFPLIVFMYPLLKIWIGPSYAPHTVALAVTLVVAQFVRLTLWPYSIVGFSAGQQNRMLASPMVEGIVNLAVSLVGVRVWGAWGVAFGTLVGAVAGIAMHIFVSMPATDSVHINRQVLLVESIFKPIMVSLPAAWVAAVLAFSSDRLLVGFAGFVGLFLGIAGLQFCFTLRHSERLELLDILARYTNRIKTVTSLARSSL
jgi:O-antigen/teichoic acid export membrane protein